MLKEYLYCSQCGIKLDIAVPSFRLLLSSENLTEKEAIEAYFNSGFSYNAILCFLEYCHDMSMSLSTLKRRLSQYNLKGNKTDGWPRQHFFKNIPCNRNKQKTMH